jgi:hypothetical protein
LAVTPRNPEDAFLREVDENFRRDQLAKFWARYGRWLVSALVIALLAFGGYLWWQGEQERRAGVAGEELTLALTKLEVGDRATALPLLDKLVKDGPGAYPALARMALAAEAVRTGDNAKAAQLYEAVAGDAKLEEPLKDMALIKAVRLRFDELPPAQVIDRLKSLTLPGNPYFPIAGEMTALAQLKAGQTANAKTMLTAIVREPSAPQSLKARAGELALSLGVSPEMLKPAGGPGLAQ